MNTNRRLYRSDDPVLAGVCGGIAEYFELDPTLVRILTVVLFLAGFGLPVVAYLIAMLIMPKRSDEYPDYIDVKPAPAQARPAATAAGATTVPNNASGASASASGTAASNNPGPIPAQANCAAATATATATAGTAAPPQPKTWTPDTPPPPPAASATGTPGAPGAAGAASAPGTPGTPGTPGAAPRYSPTSAPPGCAHTASNPRAYDVGSPVDQSTGQASAKQRVRMGVMLGILLVGIGLIALLGTFFDIAAWNFWPLIVVALGFVILCTPGKTGWSLVRAGHAISLVAIGFALQLWAFDIVATRVFVLSFLYLWPIFLVMLGLAVIGNATDKSVFKLLGSLLFVTALFFGIWNFGGIASPLHIDLPGDHDIQILIPSPGIMPTDDNSALQDNIWLFGH